MEKQRDEESIGKILLQIFQHNPRHFLKLNIFGKEFYPCARCFGLYAGILTGVFLLSPFWLGFLHTEKFVLIFIIAWIFALPNIIDWTTIKTNLRKGKNSIRIISGFSQGIGITIYFLVLPASIMFKIITYALYEIIFNIVRYCYKNQYQ